MRKISLLAIFFVLTGLAITANAVPIIFTHIGVASGTIDGTSFTNAQFRILAEGDTSDRQPFEEGYFIDHLSASITIDEVGTFTILETTRTFVNNPNMVAGFYAPVEQDDLLIGPTNSLFGSWDMLTSIGPIFGNADGAVFTGLKTNAGVLKVPQEGGFPATFQAVISTTSVPEPSTLVLLGPGLLGLVGLRKFWNNLTGV